MDVLLHGFFVVDGHGGVERVDLSANGILNGCRTARGLDDQCVAKGGRIGGDCLLEGAVEDWTSALTQRARLDVADNTDDLVGDATAFDALADGIPVAVS